MGRQTQTSMARLVANLKKIRDNSDYYKKYLQEFDDGHFYLSDTNDSLFENDCIDTEFFKELFEDLSEWLVSDNGYHHVPNRETLQQFGYRFADGDYDNQGPLNGIIIVKDIRIIYSNTV